MKLSISEKNIRIAKACGWRYIQKFTNGKTYYGLTKGQGWKNIPDYFTNLNDIHCAETFLDTTEKQNKYQENIAEICWADQERANNQVVFNQLTAPAAHRAEAFGLTLRLWKENE